MKQLLTPDKGFYKANLHCHTTISDGRFTPEEIKERYMEKGYSVVAYTDHGKLVTHDELTDENFLALNGAENAWVDQNYSVDKTDPLFQERKCSDHGLIAPKGMTELPKIPYPASTRAFTVKNINLARKTYMDAGIFLTHNHPQWSMETYNDYMSFETPNAIEIMNYGSFLSGADDHNERIYEDMLMAGKRLYCIATDDNHDKLGKPDAFGAWTVINAEKLEYDSVMDALFAGNFYSSEGPEIKELYIDDENRLHITTSPARNIRIMTATRTRFLAQNIDGTPVTGRSAKLTKNLGYFRVVVTDMRGKQAFTNAYFLEDLLEDL